MGPKTLLAVLLVLCAASGLAAREAGSEGVARQARRGGPQGAKYQ